MEYKPASRVPHRRRQAQGPLPHHRVQGPGLIPTFASSIRSIISMLWANPIAQQQSSPSIKSISSASSCFRAHLSHRGQPPLPSSNRPLALKASEASLHALGQTPRLSWDTAAVQTAARQSTDCAHNDHPIAWPCTWSKPCFPEYPAVDA